MKTNIQARFAGSIDRTHDAISKHVDIIEIGFGLFTQRHGTIHFGDPYPQLLASL